MKRILIAFTIIGVSHVYAGLSLSPEGVVRAAISAVHKDQLSLFVQCVDLPAVASHPRHALSPREVLKLLEKIDDKDIKLVTVEPKSPDGNTVVRMASPVALEPESADGRVKRMTGPVALDFEMRKTIEPNNILFVIVGIHP
jgi:hypothetical protein